MLTQGEQGWHKRITLLASFALHDVVDLAHLVLPDVARRLTVKLQDKREGIITAWGVPQGRHHGRSGYQIERANPVD